MKEEKEILTQGKLLLRRLRLLVRDLAMYLGKIVAKLTGKTAKKLATKAAEKLVEKGAEKVGEKTGQLVGEKIYDKFSTKRPADGPGPSEPMRAEFPSEAPQTKGKEIGKMLAAASKPTPPEAKQPKNKFLKINNVYADLL